jgi:hypothetical protein
MYNGCCACKCFKNKSFHPIGTVAGPIASQAETPGCLLNFFQVKKNWQLGKNVEN